MDTEDALAGFVVALLLILILWFVSIISKDEIQSNIALSCEISNRVVINDKAYKCELLK
jgi:hypothetical protein